MNNPINLILVITLVALTLAWLVFQPVLKFAIKHNIYDNPDARKLQRRPIPVLGGLVVLVASLCAVQSAWLGFDCTGILATELAMMVMWILGTWDDRKDISPVIRFGVQIAVAIALVSVNGYLIDDLHGLWGIHKFSPAVAWPLTIFAVVGIINAINLIDGVNGLSSGICISACGFYAMELFYAHDYAAAALAMAAVGALIPFFIYNVFGDRSKMFIGDGGTMMMGILLSDMVMRIMNIPDSGRFSDFGTVSFVVAVIAIPLGDTLRVMTTRMIHHKSPFSPDKTHLHHAFIKYGFTHLETALMEIILNAGIVGLWWLMYKSHFPQEWQLYIVVGSGFAVVIGLYYMLLRKERLAARMKNNELNQN